MSVVRSQRSALPSLTTQQQAAVDQTLASLDVPAKVGQLFCAYLSEPDTQAQLRHWRSAGFAPGGVFLPARDGARTPRDVQLATEWSSVPLLVAANLEEGAAAVGTAEAAFANPLQVAATGDVEHARRLGLACGTLGRALGINWAFAPVIDISMNPANPIIRTRTYGQQPDVVAAMGAAYTSAVQTCGVAASLKHFPGDGVDGRDQHLLTTDNTLSLDTWRRTFGEAYRAGIAAGAWTVMAGHIRLPALAGAAGGEATDAARPATLSHEILQGLLRDELGFDGLVVSDNTAMAGYSTAMPRAEAIPTSIKAGCDMMLGAIDPIEDYMILMGAVQRGDVPMARLDEAVQRVITLKARLGLLSETSPAEPPSVSREEIGDWRRECAERAVTLVHDQAGLLPLTSGRYPRVLVYVLGDEPTFYDGTGGYAHRFTGQLGRRGLTVTVRKVPAEGRTIRSERDVQRGHDLVVYFANVRFGGNSNDLRLTWSHPQGPEAPRHPEVPTVMVSIADPYHLADVPSIGAYVNAYSPTEHTVDAVVAALFGDLPFQGRSPVDPAAASSANAPSGH